MLIMPSVRIPARDWTRLMQLAFDSDSAGEPCAPFFRNEVHRAIVLDDGECPHDIVCLNAWVTYSIDAGPAETRLLVHPDDHQADSVHLSVLSPAGAALLGIRVGDRMPFVGADDALHVASALSVRQAPEGLRFFRTRE